MADNDDRAKTEITAPILDAHADIRRRFVELWNERSSDSGAVALDAAWQPLASLLENHAIAQEDRAEPVSLREGNDDTPEETVESRPVEEERGVIRDFPEHSDETPLSRPETQ